ncbi:MAG: hypothetical protein LBT13_11165, partial [Treponema sp.]|nr:hypothetical protein [Treponema sp.]
GGGVQNYPWHCYNRTTLKAQFAFYVSPLHLKPHPLNPLFVKSTIPSNEKQDQKTTKTDNIRFCSLAVFPQFQSTAWNPGPFFTVAFNTPPLYLAHLSINIAHTFLFIYTNRQKCKKNQIKIFLSKNNRKFSKFPGRGLVISLIDSICSKKV